jgi:hypothetical protein
VREEWLRSTLDDARAAPGGARQLDATFADAAREWLRYVEHDRGCKPSTLRSYRSSLEAHLLPAFGDLALHEITPLVIERWRAGLTSSPRTRTSSDRAVRRLSARAEGLRAAEQPRRAGREAPPAPAP